MQKIKTATGKEYEVLWCGPSTIDMALRFEVVNVDMNTVIATFTNAKETGRLTHLFDERETVFNNYTQFKGVDLKPDGSIVVALMEKST